MTNGASPTGIALLHISSRNTDRSYLGVVWCGCGVVWCVGRGGEERRKEKPERHSTVSVRAQPVDPPCARAGLTPRGAAFVSTPALGWWWRTRATTAIEIEITTAGAMRNAMLGAIEMARDSLFLSSSPTLSLSITYGLCRLVCDRRPPCTRGHACVLPRGPMLRDNLGACPPQSFNNTLHSTPPQHCIATRVCNREREVAL